MKKTCFFLLLLLTHLGLRGQPTGIAYYDALYLKENCIDPMSGAINIDENCKSILKYYSVDNQNPFIRLPDGTVLSADTSAGGGMGAGRLLSSIGGLDVTAFADGLAQFLVERTKEELNEAFFRKFTVYLKNYPEFKILFPNTNTLVNNFESWEYANIINTLREAFDKDIKSLLGNFIELRNLQSATACHDLKKKENCETRINSINAFFNGPNGRLLLSAMAIGNGVMKEQKIPDILDTLALPGFIGGYPNANVANGIKLASIFSAGIRSNAIDHHYLSEDEFDLLFTPADDLLRKLFLGLLYGQIAAGNIQFTANGSVYKAKDFLSNINGAVNYLKNFQSRAVQLDKAIKKLQEDKLRSAYSDLSGDYALIFSASQGLIASATNVNVISTSIQLPEEFRQWLNYSNGVLQIAHDISVRNYNAAVMSTLKILDDVANSQVLNEGFKQFTSAFVKYGSFAANVVNSKDPTQVKEAIKSFVLPSGSSSMKKHSEFSIDVNAYVGFAYGLKIFPTHNNFTVSNSGGGKDTIRLNEGKSYAIYAPIGLTFSHGLGWKSCKNPGSVSLFLSLVDIGAIVGYRFVTDTGQVSNKTRVNLGNIFAPGVNLAFGLPNMPLSIGGGFQWIPTLQRNSSSNEFYNLDYSGWRAQLFIGVDIPMLRLHTSGKSLVTPKKSTK